MSYHYILKPDWLPITAAQTFHKWMDIDTGKFVLDKLPKFINSSLKNEIEYDSYNSIFKNFGYENKPPALINDYQKKLWYETKSPILWSIMIWQ